MPTSLAWPGLQRPVARQHFTVDQASDVGKIALAHLNEFPDYYTRLASMEAEAEAFWQGRR